MTPGARHLKANPNLSKNIASNWNQRNFSSNKTKDRHLKTSGNLHETSNKQQTNFLDIHLNPNPQVNQEIQMKTNTTQLLGWGKCHHK